jgi:hypothetical protein
VACRLAPLLRRPRRLPRCAVCIVPCTLSRRRCGCFAPLQRRKIGRARQTAAAGESLERDELRQRGPGKPERRLKVRKLNTHLAAAFDLASQWSLAEGGVHQSMLVEPGGVKVLPLGSQGWRMHSQHEYGLSGACLVSVFPGEGGGCIRGVDEDIKGDAGSPLARKPACSIAFL